MNLVNQNKHLLITIAISHYCEKVRWALDLLEIDYIEESHAPPFHRKYTSHYGGTTVPVLVIDNQALIDSEAILHYLNTIAPHKQLYPQDVNLRREIETIERLCNDQLGTATRCWSYYYAMQKPKLLKKAWDKGTNINEQQQNALAFPQTFKLLQQKYNITAAGKQVALQTIQDIFATLSQKLSLGQRYLVGDRLSAADITFAALASPVIRPENHPIYASQLSTVSAEMREVIESLRATPAGELVLHMYRAYRNRSIS